MIFFPGSDNAFIFLLLLVLLFIIDLIIGNRFINHCSHSTEFHLIMTVELKTEEKKSLHPIISLRLIQYES